MPVALHCHLPSEVGGVRRCVLACAHLVDLCLGMAAGPCSAPPAPLSMPMLVYLAAPAAVCAMPMLHAAAVPRAPWHACMPRPARAGATTRGQSPSAWPRSSTPRCVALPTWTWSSRPSNSFLLVGVVLASTHARPACRALSVAALVKRQGRRRVRGRQRSVACSRQCTAGPHGANTSTLLTAHTPALAGRVAEPGHGRCAPVCHMPRCAHLPARPPARLAADRHEVPLSTRIITSYHDFKQTPDAATLSKLIDAMWKSGADIVKVCAPSGVEGGGGREGSLSQAWISSTIRGGGSRCPALFAIGLKSS